MGVGLAAILALPYVIWNAGHGWAHLEFLRNAAGGKNTPVTPLGFLVGQVVYQNPLNILVWVPGLWFFFRRAGRSVPILRLGLRRDVPGDDGLAGQGLLSGAGVPDPVRRRSRVLGVAQAGKGVPRVHGRSHRIDRRPRPARPADRPAHPVRREDPGLPQGARRAESRGRAERDRRPAAALRGHVRLGGDRSPYTPGSSRS